MNNWMKVGLAIAMFSMSAMADSDDHHNNNNGNGNHPGGVVESGLVGSVPNTTIGGIQSGGAPWTIASSEVTVSTSGRLHLEVKGLLIAVGGPPNLVGTVGPVQMVAASLVCGGSGGVVMASTGGVPLSPSGNAEIGATITPPATCMAPVVLVRIFDNSAAPGNQLGRFIAVSGFNMSTAGGGMQTSEEERGDH